MAINGVREMSQNERVSSPPFSFSFLFLIPSVHSTVYDFFSRHLLLILYILFSLDHASSLYLLASSGEKEQKRRV